MWHSVMAMAYSLLISSFINQLINTWPNKKLLNYGYFEQMKDILPGILLAVFMGICITPVRFLGLPDLITIILMVSLGAVVYVGASIVLKIESFTYLWGIVKPIVLKVVKKN